ncbi:Rap/Ran GTPase activating protein, putative [Entamoeba histolytica KU27]|uniref:Rap/Ran GTPase activating protein, putative n=1 Tax=Entamoeba histolytica KU27 TaxID=885311 RepID=M2RMB9_ENTHI|nr:Rap/Ran GTPase activating protein, putative [Entamoeba histolytica KU27]
MIPTPRPSTCGKINLWVNLYCAQYIPLTSKFGERDLVGVIVYEKQNKGNIVRVKSNVEKNTLNPIWNTPVFLKDVVFGSVLFFEIIENNKVIAKALYPVQNIPNNKRMTYVLPLITPTLTYSGILRVVCYEGNTEQDVANVIFKFSDLEEKMPVCNNRSRLEITAEKISGIHSHVFWAIVRNKKLCYYQKKHKSEISNNKFIMYFEIENEDSLEIKIIDKNGFHYSDFISFKEKLTSFKRIETDQYVYSLKFIFTPVNKIPPTEILPPECQEFITDDWYTSMDIDVESFIEYESPEKQTSLVTYETFQNFHVEYDCDCITDTIVESCPILNRHYLDKPIRDVISQENNKKIYSFGDSCIVCCGEPNQLGVCKAVILNPKNTIKCYLNLNTIDDDIDSMLMTNIHNKVKVIPNTMLDKIIFLEDRLNNNKEKFGIVVGIPGQVSENEFLSNKEPSPLALEFFNLLGQTIQLKGFTKYKAGLDVVTNTTGTQSLFTEFCQMEIMFHVSTMLQHVEGDDQFLDKKRHIGNDVCVIIFKEGNESVDISSFVSHFNHVFIVVHPVIIDSKELYEVVVVTKLTVKAFRPRFPESKYFQRDSTFRDLLLQKLINGERASLLVDQFIQSQSIARKGLINEIIVSSTQKKK